MIAPHQPPAGPGTAARPGTPRRYRTSASWNPATPGPAATATTALAFLAMGMGPAIVRAPALAGILLFGALAAAALPVARTALHDTGEARLRAGRLLAYLAGMALLAALFGWGRAGLVPTVGLPDRYVLLAAPAVLWIHVAVETHATRTLRAGLQGALLAAALVLLPLNVRDGLEWRAWYRAGMEAVLADVREGHTRADIVDRHTSFLMHWAPEQLFAAMGIAMGMLRDAGVGPLAAVRDE